MSLPISIKTWGLAPCSTSQLVLQALADRADHHGGSIYPSLADTARRTKLTIRSVRRALRILETAGLLVATHRRPGKPTNYQIILPSNAPTSDPMTDGEGHSDPAPRTECPPTSDTRSDKLSLNHSITTTQPANARTEVVNFEVVATKHLGQTQNIDPTTLADINQRCLKPHIKDQEAYRKTLISLALAGKYEKSRKPEPDQSEKQLYYSHIASKMRNEKLNTKVSTGVTAHSLRALIRDSGERRSGENDS